MCRNCERLSLHCRPFEFIVRSAWCPTSTNHEAVEEQPEHEQAAAEPAASGTNSTNGSSNLTTPSWTSAPASPVSTSPATTESPTATSVSLLVSTGNEPTTTSPSSYSSCTSISSPRLAATAKPSVAPLSINAEVAHLLSVYTSSVATWMDLFDHGRSYQLEVPRRCLTSALLTRCVCAFTAKQLSLLPSGDIWSVSAAQYYGNALRLLIQHLDSSPGSTPGDALTANMLLSSYEMLDARDYEHQRHLRGASALIKMQGINARSGGMDRANFWIYVRHEITIALENETALQFSHKYWTVDWRQGEVGEDALGNQLMWLVARAIDLIHAPEPSPSSSDDSSVVLLDIHSEASVWLNNLPVSFLGVKCGDVDDLGLVKTHFAVPTAGEHIYPKYLSTLP